MDEGNERGGQTGEEGLTRYKLARQVIRRAVCGCLDAVKDVVFQQRGPSI